MTESFSESQGGLFVTESLPAYTRLTVTEIQDIARKGLGLRATSPRNFASEITLGVKEGDFLLIYDVGHFLSMQDEFEGMSDVIQRKFTDEDPQRKKDLIGLDALPQRYESALTKFFEKRAIPALADTIITPQTTVHEYLSTIPDHTPGLLIVQDPYPRPGHDHEQYFGFSKRGRGWIAPKNIVGSSLGVAHQDQLLLTRRYSRYLNTPAGTQSFDAGEPDLRLFKRIERDVATMLTGKTIGLLRQSL